MGVSVWLVGWLVGSIAAAWMFAVVGCGSETELPPVATMVDERGAGGLLNGGPGGEAQGLPTGGAQPGPTGGIVFPLGGGVPGGGLPMAGGGAPAGGASGGMMAESGGSMVGPTGGSEPPSGGTGMPAPPGRNEPVIPEITGECPSFQSGPQRIMELETEIRAGTPGATPGPLLFAWHGTGGTGGIALVQVPSSVQDDIMAQGGIIIAPTDGGTRSGADVTFILGVWFDGHDLDFADLITACAVQNHNIDPRRIYTTGCSAGGLMAGTMAIQRSSYVAASAPNSGGVVLAGALEDSMRVPAIFAMHGGTSDNVIVNFQDTTNNLANALVAAGSFFVDCNHGMGHCGAPVSLHEAAWEFMMAHPFGTDPSPYAGGLPANVPDYCEVR